MTSRSVRFGVWYDFRNPEPWTQPYEDLYAETLDQIEWAETLGYGSVWLSEHHFCDDGYTPSPLVIAGAVGARTKKMVIGTNVLLLPLHDPIRIAEDSATLSIMTGGRFDLGVGLGYREEEFYGFRRDLSKRPSTFEESVEVIRRAWSGEPVGFEGKRISVPDVRVTPAPEHGPQLLLGGMSQVAVDRVARIGDGFLCAVPAHLPLYTEALTKAGKDPSQGRVYSGQWAIIDDDPEKMWSEIGDHALYQVNQYIRWGAFGPDLAPFEHRDDVTAAGMYQLWDAATAVSELTTLLSDWPQIEDVYFWAKLPGEAIETSSRRVEYLASRVMPEVKARLSS
jgi:alkanesulfonate monooxygenase SsuD/methylene tetrahydromethanopterin reductase-like flavin-dependent oxidoreductase (luciferase family)